MPDEPISTLDTSNRHAVVAGFLAKHFGDSGQRPGSELHEPVSTITASDHNALVAANLTHQYSSNTNGGAGDPAYPLKTQTTGNHAGLVCSFLQAYYGQYQQQSPATPLATIPTRDRFGLVTVQVEGEPYILADIAMRMLQPGELYGCQGFPSSYVYDRGIDEDGRVVRFTKTEQVRMCGNSVSPMEAKALAGANLPELVVRDEARPAQPKRRRARKEVAV
jgi:DNA (cytosine-5)-methyltransferase 1